MSKRMCCAVVLCLVSSFAWSESLSPSFEVGTSVVWGQTMELVLRDGTYNNPDSRLIWETPPALALNIGVEWPWTKETSTKVSVQGSWPLMSGTMVDEDWAYAGIRYGKSTGEARLTSRWAASAEETLKWREWEFSLGGLYRDISWQNWNGHAHYAYVDGVVEDDTFSGLMIAYRQTWLIPFVGVQGTWGFDGLALTPSLRLSPYSWCFDTDNHLYRQLTFQDNLRAGWYGAVAFEAAFKDSGGVVWGVRAGWEIDIGAIGDDFESTPSVNTSATGAFGEAAGAWFHEGSLSVFVRE